MDKPKGLNPLYRKVEQYVKDRGITKEDIIRYNLGYCDSGIYSNRIIIPSYDRDNRLNYFMHALYLMRKSLNIKIRQYQKMLQSSKTKLIGKNRLHLLKVYLMISCKKRNAIPLLGKFIPKTLMDSIYKNGVKEIKIILDKDVQDQALYYVSYFMNNGITVTNILPTEKDAGDMGFSEVNKKLKQTKKSGFE